MVEFVFTEKYPKDIPMLMIVVGNQYETQVKKIFETWDDAEQYSPKDLCIQI